MFDFFLFFFFFYLRGMWDHTPPPGIELAYPTLESKVLTTGLPGKSCIF